VWLPSFRMIFWVSQVAKSRPAMFGTPRACELGTSRVLLVANNSQSCNSLAYLSIRAWWIKSPTTSMPAVPSGQSPHYRRAAGNVGRRGGQDSLYRLEVNSDRELTFIAAGAHEADAYVQGVRRTVHLGIRKKRKS
jgi:hypothetical protein